MLRAAIAAFVLASVNAMISTAAFAQWGAWAPWDDDRVYRRYPYPYQYQRPYREPPGRGFPPEWGWGDDDLPGRPQGPAFRSGGPRPEIEPVAPSRIAFPSSYPVGSIVIDHKGRQ